MTKWGYFLSSEELSPPEIVRNARVAEEAGFDRVWVSDHFHPWQSSQGESPFVWSVLGAIAATTNLRMTTAVTCPTFRIHPAILAQATATTATLAPGRFTFGIGSGEALNEHILGDAWPPVSVRHERLTEAVELIRRLWSGETVTHRGRHYTVHNAKIFSRPDEPPPIYVSGFGDKAIRLAAQAGDGWITVRPDADGLRSYRRFGGQGGTQAGVKICWAPTEEEAAETAWRLWGHEGTGGQASQDVPTWHTFEALGAASSPDEAARKVACGPDPKRAADVLAQYADAGFDEVYVAQIGPDQAGGIRFLAEEVLPLLPPR
ncbi:TIGR03557 family F420-dependent LLM class oxidoreductase [Frankia sp. CNm7]|uniref:TIGR03557 family F420-dependent LLM class oxidoreductase n=1 Tax=Frankia nepalensis TaxID=1836974 RepID=A0A937R5Z5_9ACTN|nr:TIGR03557 family F420-dependent LLM class oxidoreductase [Frankia nepalensis]MBL7501790.1 TIGR03557 family F420-dependent LLM class oxidoreductase [Frankia nepalensis]MBL7513886.1 TIGR03557 family F420-dependent LLM class oxidoreductase [Frankia nepalensis]MBL7523970.1 TIGR03557 family F420-dependent LLM class oxidoreductase [Frankia nepalensis]MBL7626358.1 TIGR03557 family F420-dependent LLM class oxidoreductase [Frankia nepalensis]